MGKRIIALCCVTFLVTATAHAEEALFDYKQLEEDSPNSAFVRRFSNSRAFHCYKNGKAALHMSIGITSKGFSSDKEIEDQFLKKVGVPLNWGAISDFIQIDLGIQTRSGYQRTYVSAGKPQFDSNQNMKYMRVELLNGKKVEFTRFAPIPDFPFNTKRKLKPFFYYQVAGDPRYECGAINQPD